MIPSRLSTWTASGPTWLPWSAATCWSAYFWVPSNWSEQDSLFSRRRRCIASTRDLCMPCAPSWQRKADLRVSISHTTWSRPYSITPWHRCCKTRRRSLLIVSSRFRQATRRSCTAWLNWVWICSRSLSHYRWKRSGNGCSARYERVRRARSGSRPLWHCGLCLTRVSWMHAIALSGKRADGGKRAIN